MNMGINDHSVLPIETLPETEAYPLYYEAINERNQNFIDSYTELILKVLPNKDPQVVRLSVQNKIFGLLAQEPFYLQSVLWDNDLSDADKVAMYIGVHSNNDGAIRYSHKYHRDLVNKTNKLRDKREKIILTNN